MEQINGMSMHYTPLEAQNTDIGRKNTIWATKLEQIFCVNLFMSCPPYKGPLLNVNRSFPESFSNNRNWLVGGHLWGSQIKICK